MQVYFVFGLVFQYQAKRLAGRNVFKMAYFVSGGT